MKEQSDKIIIKQIINDSTCHPRWSAHIRHNQRHRVEQVGEKFFANIRNNRLRLKNNIFHSHLLLHSFFSSFREPFILAYRHDSALQAKRNSFKAEAAKLTHRVAESGNHCSSENSNAGMRARWQTCKLAISLVTSRQFLVSSFTVWNHSMLTFNLFIYEVDLTLRYPALICHLHGKIRSCNNNSRHGIYR